jgi:hypothetical protein
LASKPKVGKTRVALNLVYYASKGKTFLNRRIMKVKSLYLSFPGEGTNGALILQKLLFRLPVVQLKRWWLGYLL